MESSLLAAASENDEEEGPKCSGGDVMSQHGTMRNDGGRRVVRQTRKEKGGSSSSKGNDPFRFEGDGLPFRAKLIGSQAVPEARGDRMCQDALTRLKMAVRASGEHKQRVQLTVSLQGIKMRDDKSGELVFHHPVHRISFISQDASDARAFGYVCMTQDGCHRFVAIKTEKAASQLVVALRDLFQVVLEMKQHEMRLAREEQQQQLQAWQMPPGSDFSLRGEAHEVITLTPHQDPANTKGIMQMETTIAAAATLAADPFDTSFISNPAQKQPMGVPGASHGFFSEPATPVGPPPPLLPPPPPPSARGSHCSLNPALGVVPSTLQQQHRAVPPPQSLALSSQPAPLVTASLPPTPLPDLLAGQAAGLLGRAPPPPRHRQLPPRPPPTASSSSLGTEGGSRWQTFEEEGPPPPAFPPPPPPPLVDCTSPPPPLLQASSSDIFSRQSDDPFADEFFASATTALPQQQDCLTSGSQAKPVASLLPPTGSPWPASPQTASFSR
ncbi:uncharacterized protein LOC144162516 isoform X3 [Haemaphysalis longicornis]